jgi:hypothetical protein
LIRRHWGDPRFWAWWWRYKFPLDLKWLLGLLAVGVLMVGGFSAATGVTTEATTSVEPLESLVTVRKLVTVREQGRVVTQARRVVRTVQGDSSTRYETQVLFDTVTGPASTYVLTQRDVRSVPVVERLVVTRNGDVQTIVQTQPGVTLTRTAVVTDQRTVTDERVITSERVVTRERTVTETLPVTVRSTETNVVTATVPVTVIETLPVTVTESITVTVRKP